MSFRELHYGETPLLLPNAWDAGSAIAFADSGFPAVGTTSFGVGAAAGHADGARASKDATTRLVRALTGLPAYVSADIERRRCPALEEHRPRDPRRGPRLRQPRARRSGRVHRPPRGVSPPQVLLAAVAAALSAGIKEDHGSG
jgi:hypothetical protein